MNSKLRSIIQNTNLDRLDSDTRGNILRNFPVSGTINEICKKVENCLGEMLSQIKKSYLENGIQDENKNYLELYGSSIYYAIKMFSNFQTFIDFVKESPYRRDFLARFIDNFIGDVDDDFYFPVSRFDGRKLLEILEAEEKKGTAFSHDDIRIKSIILSCVDTQNNSRYKNISLDSKGGAHEAEMCGAAERTHLRCLEYKGRCIYVELNGEIIGHIKATGEKSFLSYVNLNDKDGNTVLIQGGLYSINGGYEIFLPTHNFQGRDDTSIFVVQFDSAIFTFGRFSGLMKTDIYFSSLLEKLESKNRISVNKVVIDFLDGLHNRTAYEADEMKYFRENLANSGFIIPTL